ncbi:MAG: hypothetical protein FWD18_11225 [Micrococcales bacterium]|nr:hypothetical protein [Micrococcales bacterium]
MSRQREARQKQAARERREENRRRAVVEQARHRRVALLKRAGLWAGAAVLVAGVVTGVVIGVRAWIEVGQTGPTNMASDGLLLTGDGTMVTPVLTDPIPAGGLPVPTDTGDRALGIVDIVVYVDYADPASAAFWAAGGDLITGAVTSGSATLEIHPVALPASLSPTTSPTPTPADDAETTEAAEATGSPERTHADLDYARRAANAFACVASHSPDHALAMHRALLVAQPTAGTDGLTDAETIDLARTLGADDAVGCLRTNAYRAWVRAATDRAMLATPFTAVGALTQTPTVVVAGQRYTGSLTDAEDLMAFITAVHESLVPVAPEEPFGDDQASLEDLFP